MTVTKTGLGKSNKNIFLEAYIICCSNHESLHSIANLHLMIFPDFFVINEDWTSILLHLYFTVNPC